MVSMTPSLLITPYADHVTKNRLASASSPYLQQHADNPVDWFPWGSEALEKAAREDKPLFLSIGYASCHWCHVMAHESFEDEEVAALVNRSFVAIKIDREERPDLDQIYMAATQASTGHGGWPMTVFATPDGRPFFTGTYFPPSDRGGQPSFTRVLLSLEDAWATQRSMVEEQADILAAAVAKESRLVDSLTIDVEGSLQLQPILTTLVDELAERFDGADGGFGGAPKFPRPSYIDACLLDAARTGRSESLAMATTTLDMMAAGGIYDHLAGGFARYSVDRHWLVPHFEKMLTDQALLARTYLHGYLLTGNPSYAQVVRETVEWVLGDLRLESGGYASSIDADAAGHEGSHAVFTPSDIETALRGHDDALTPSDAMAFYGITEEGTFEHGKSMVTRQRHQPLLRNEAEEVTRRLLLDVRQHRPQPAIDDKLLLEWNAMFASVLSQAAFHFENPLWAADAATLLDTLLTTMRDPSGRLLRSARHGVAAHLAMLGDYAWLIEALTRQFELDGDGRWLDEARSLCDTMLELFWDGPLPTPAQPDNGAGFFTTGSDAEALLVRAKDLFDGALPSATAVAVTALARLAVLTNHDQSRLVAERMVNIASSILTGHPTAVPDLVISLGWLRSTIEVVTPGPPGRLRSATAKTFIPFGLAVAGHDVRCSLLANRHDGVGYVCHHGTCQQPVTTEKEIVALLGHAVRA